MFIDRRRLFTALAAAAATSAATPARARGADDGERAGGSDSFRDFAARPAIDAATLGLRPNLVEDQSATFQATTFLLLEAATSVRESGLKASVKYAPAA